MFVMEFWDMYEKLGKETYQSMTFYHCKLGEIMNEYFYPLSKTKKDFFGNLGELQSLSGL
jgi:hypothetical protein